MDIPSSLELTYFNSDPNRIRQIILNFLSNSLKFTLKGSIALSIRKEKNIFNLKKKLLFPLYRITVADTGVGISVAGIKNIFTAFNKT